MLLVAGRIADAVLRSVAESRLADHLRTTTAAGGVTVSIHSSPFLLRLAVAGSVDGVEISAEAVPVGGMTLDRVDLSAHGVRIERGSLLLDQRLQVLSAASADIIVAVTAQELSAVLERPVEITGGSVVRVLVAGQWVTLGVTVEHGHVLALDAGSIRSPTWHNSDLSVST